MIPITKYKAQQVAVFGLGVSGLSAARALMAGGAEVSVWDDAADRRNQATKEGLTVQDLTVQNFKGISALILSPGVPLTHPKPHPVAQRALDENCPVIGDIELFVMSEVATKDRSIVAVTGTNGKSTTTALIGKIISHAGKDVVVAGNIGAPILDARIVEPGGVYVIEMSSYQIDLTPSLDADVSVLLNITPDHLERHGGMEGYARVKAKLAQQQSANKTAVVGIDDDHCRAIYQSLKHEGSPHPLGISIETELDEGIFVRNGILYDHTGEAARAVAEINKISSLPGVHNWQNIAAAYASANALGISDDLIIAAIKSFHGLEHRMEHVAKFASVDIINDSKATNMAAAARALACYSSIYWIAGGRPKGESLNDLSEHFGNIRKAYLYGEAGPEFGESLEGIVPCEVDETLQVATQSAIRDSLSAAQAEADDLVVMLSPACASFDQFANFEARGDAFKDYVMSFAAGDAQ